MKKGAEGMKTDADRVRGWMGHPDQQLQVRRFRLSGGREEGLECIDVQAGSGLSFTVVSGHGMSIQACRYRGINLTYLPFGGSSGPGMTWQMEEYFEGGLMFTCGLDNTGPANGSYGLHGLVRRLPAQNVTVSRRFVEGGQEVEIKGQVIQSGLAVPSLVLERRIRCGDLIPEIWIHDRIFNASGIPAGWMIMYHFNIGWPLLSPKARLHIPGISIKPKNETAARDLDTCLRVLGPQPRWQPQVFFHTLDPEADRARIAIENHEAGIGAAITVNPGQLPYLTQWRDFREGEYVLGLEPCNVLPLGRSRTEAQNRLPVLEPGEERQMDLTFRVWDLQ